MLIFLVTAIPEWDSDSLCEPEAVVFIASAVVETFRDSDFADISEVAVLTEEATVDTFLIPVSGAIWTFNVRLALISPRELLTMHL